MGDYSVYIMASHARMLDIGVTNNLERRVSEHELRLDAGYTKRYNLTRLVYYEDMPDIREAIGREKQLKGWRRSKKVALIESANPRWRDLAQDW